MGNLVEGIAKTAIGAGIGGFFEEVIRDHWEAGVVTGGMLGLVYAIVSGFQKYHKSGGH